MWLSICINLSGSFTLKLLNFDWKKFLSGEKKKPRKKKVRKIKREIA